VKQWLLPTGPAVGLMPDLVHTVSRAHLDPGDTLLVFTDGVTDAQDKTGQPFTKGRLEELLAVPFSTAEELIHRIRTRITHHIAGVDQFDDITLAALPRQ
jgi:phosphoserine phosphatase RsbU/P